MVTSNVVETAALPPGDDPRALILAAGVGRRLGTGAGEQPRPKALLDFGGKSLLARHVELLRSLGVCRIAVVAGYQAEQIDRALAAFGGDGLSVIVNPDFREGSVVSLWAGREVLRGGSPVILMDADVLYDRRLLGRLIDSSKNNCLLVDRELEPGDEPVKVCVRDGRIVDFHKRPTALHEWHGESVGFFRLSPDVAAELADRAEAYVSGGKRMMEYEEPIRDMITGNDGGRFDFEDVTGLPWTEIDFPEDLQKARALLAQMRP